MLTTAVAAAALLAGLTGAWSPCAFSAVDTLRHSAGARAAFAGGAVLGGLVTFSALAAAGAALGLAAPWAAALVAIAAAAAEAARLRIAPQVRRQVPESWRRRAPLPVAGAGYGVLLGLGWTTFVLTYALPALAAACVLLGSVGLGAVAGVAFGLGRAAPVLLRLAVEQRPHLLARTRRLNAVALSVLALAAGAAPAAAATEVVTSGGTDPSVEGDLVAWHEPGTTGVLVRPGGAIRLPGTHPVLADGLIAWREGDRVVWADPRTLTPLGQASAPGGPFDFAGEYLAWRTTDLAGTEWLSTQPGLGNPATPPTIVLRVPAGRQIGRPAVTHDGSVVAHVAGLKGTRLVRVKAGVPTIETLRDDPRAQLLNPSVHGDALLYVRATATRQELRLGLAVAGVVEDDAVVFSTTPTVRRDAGHEPGRGRHKHYPSRRPPPQPARPARGFTDTLWTTALTPTHAYVTRLRVRRGRTPAATVLRIPLLAG